MDNEQKDEQLWRIAKKRAAVKQTFFAYIFINTFLMGIWYFSSGTESYFWPKWPLLSLGFALMLQYFDAYHGNAVFSAEDEYQKLKRNKNQ
jgi:hypothetical protein